MQNSIRLSVGTAALLGLESCKLDASPTTAYTMTYTRGRCSANCGFCAQARGSKTSASRLSRVTWPSFSLPTVTASFLQMQGQLPFKRLCIQSLRYPQLEEDLIQLIHTFKEIAFSVPISVAIPPLTRAQLIRLKREGVDRVAVSIDTATPELFHAIKGSGVNGPFTWKDHFRALDLALSIFGPNRTTTHLIIGLGETELEAVHFIQRMTDQSITVGLFPFTPIEGTHLASLPRINIQIYRRLQLAHFLIQQRLSHIDKMTFETKTKYLQDFGVPDQQLNKIINKGVPFQTAGCPACNRPFFTESPGGPIYNFPGPLSIETIHEILQQLGGNY